MRTAPLHIIDTPLVSRAAASVGLAGSVQRAARRPLVVFSPEPTQGMMAQPDTPDSRRGPATEDGIVIGNAYNKYSSRNPIARAMMEGFLVKFDALRERSGAGDVHEVGCGEGELSIRMARAGIAVRGTDFSRQIVDEARSNASTAGVSAAFRVASIYDLAPERDAASLIVCCEVLEHLEEPERALGVLETLARPYLLVSVPREPIWRALNVARGKYLRDWGNTPGHFQHWSKRGFLDLIRTRFDVVEEDSPLPWTMALCRVPLR